VNRSWVSVAAIGTIHSGKVSVAIRQMVKHQPYR
jgi:hypothetical protein